MGANRNLGCLIKPERKILCPPLSIDKEAADSTKALKLLSPRDGSVFPLSAKSACTDC
jgi:hypothetical protein